MESIFSNEYLIALGYWISVTLILFGCMGFAYVWTMFEERHR